MLTLIEFYDKYVGKSVDYDGVALNQCVDLAKAYMQECVGIRTYGRGTSVWGDAINYKNLPGAMSKYLYRVTYTPGMIPIPGDMVVFNTGEHGHISIVINNQSTDKALYTFDQNYGKNKKCHMVKHTYDNVVCFIRRPRVTMWNVNVRTGPSLSACQVGELAVGTSVKPIDYNKQFVELSAGRWIHYNSLNKI